MQNLYANSKTKTNISNLVAIAKIIENLKATTAEVRNIARTVLCYEWVVGFFVAFSTR